MSKQINLAAALQNQDGKGQGSEASQPSKTAAKAKAPNSREGLANIAGWFPINVKFELDELRLELSRKAGQKITMQEIQAEAYNDLFKKYGRPELAPDWRALKGGQGRGDAPDAH